MAILPWVKSAFVYSESESGIFKQILRSKLDLETEPWPSISDSAKDLVRKMLTRDPKRRQSAHEVLCKPHSVPPHTTPPYVNVIGFFTDNNVIPCQVIHGLLMIQ